MSLGFTLQYITCFSLECECEPEPEPSNNQQQQQQLVVPTTSIIMSTEQHQEQSSFQDYDEQQQHHHHHQQQQQDGSGGNSGGLIASGLSWFDKQREKKKREKLKMEAEKQLQKIKDASSLLAEEGGDDNISSSSLSHQDHNHNYNHYHNHNRTPHQQPIELTANRSIGSTASVDSADVSCSKSGIGASGKKIDLNDVVTLGANNNNNNDENYNINDNNNNNNTNNNEEEDEIIPPVRVTHVDGDEDSPYILNTDQMYSIAENVLPETVTYCRWRRLYSLNRDGDSFDGCLRIIGTSKRTLMVVKTTRGEIFGGYADAPWHSRQSHATAKFYGSASSCLFSFPSSSLASSLASSSSSSSLPSTTTTATTTKDRYNSEQRRSSSSPSSSPIDVYRWTGKNRYIQVCDVSTKLLAFGGGGDKGAFGLCLQEDFQRGTTGHCDTFDNEPLCEEGNFDVVDVEFWEFLTGVF
jgi:hypothetical protein